MLMIIIIIAVVAVMGIVTFVIVGGSKKKTEQEIANSGGALNPVDNGDQTQSAFMSTLAHMLGMIGINGLGGGTQANSVQQFIPLDDIRDSVIVVHSQTGVPYYRMMVECSSINYDLKSEEEQAEVDSIFQSAITSWQFPWGIYVQTRKLDDRDFVEGTIESVAQTIQLYPQLAEYGDAYIKFLRSNQEKDVKSLIVKKKYIVVACNDAFEQVDLDDNDKFEWARQKLTTNCGLIMNYMRRLGIAAKVCRTEDLIEIMFESMNKQEGGMVDALHDGDFLNGSVNSIDKENIPPEDLQRIIQEFVNQLDACIIEHPDADEATRKEAISLRKEAVEMKNSIRPKHEDTLLDKLWEN